MLYRAPIAIVSLLLAGCGAPTPDIVPTPQLARSTLKKVLDARVAGTKERFFSNVTPRIQVVDSSWLPTDALKSFKIAGEIPSEGHRVLVAKLHFADRTETESVRYVIIGIDPILVFRQQDFEQISHWEHAMDDPAKAQSPTSEAPRANQGSEQPAKSE